MRFFSEWFKVKLPHIRLVHVHPSKFFVSLALKKYLVGLNQHRWNKQCPCKLQTKLISMRMSYTIKVYAKLIDNNLPWNGHKSSVSIQRLYLIKFHAKVKRTKYLCEVHTYLTCSLANCPYILVQRKSVTAGLSYNLTLQKMAFWTHHVEMCFS